VPRGVDVRLELFEFFVVYQLEDQVQVADQSGVIRCIRLVGLPLQHQESVKLRDCGFYGVQRRFRVPEERLFLAEEIESVHVSNEFEKRAADLA